ncbi:MAG TPA: helix-turn-helix domain-containing protein [Burkholderiales bacterium]|nr:helix-turn-helix domain-containing protein [Burkholderiales bacterium]
MSDTVEAPSVPAETGPGRALARLREERKLSVADVAQRLKYGARQIEALEAEEFDRLPGATFVRGMVRGYAKLLETDPEPILAALEQRYVPGEISLDLRAKRVPFPQGGKRSGTRVYLVLSLIVFLVVAGVLYEWRVGAFPWVRLAHNAPTAARPAKPPVAPPVAPSLLPEAPPAPAVASAEKPPVVQAPVPAAPQPQVQPQATGAEARVRLEFGGESWVEIRDAEGKMLMSQLNPTGSRRVVSGQPPLSFVIGNAANVRLTYNDKPVDLKPYIQIEVARLTLD